MNLVKIIPITQRAKNRVKEHGSEMTLLKDLQTKFLVRSLGPTSQGERWIGWFTTQEAKFVIVQNPVY